MKQREDFERAVRDHLERLDPATRTALFRVLALPDDERAREIQQLYVGAKTINFAELLMDLEVDRRSRDVVVRLLREERVREG